jgi:hypothetical protein
MQFGFVTVVPKYLNFATFSKDLLAICKFKFTLLSGSNSKICLHQYFIIEINVEEHLNYKNQNMLICFGKCLFYISDVKLPNSKSRNGYNFNAFQ